MTFTTFTTIALTAVLLATTAVAAPPAEPGPAPIRLDQLGFETDGPKTAILPTDDDAPRAWQLIDAAGRTVASGMTTPFGTDAASGERVQRIDAGRLSLTGTGYRFVVGNAHSRRFAIAPAPFHALATASLGFFYQQRSGMPIEARYVERPDLARAAGQPHERVTCFAGHDMRGVDWPGCRYTLDTTGGWYDAGDQGKYVVNGGIAAWTLLDLHERLAACGDAQAFADGRLPIPERGNGTDDLLDEARIEVQFLLSMQVPDGARLRIATRTDTGAPASGFEEIDAGGLVHTKVADAQWTGIPTAPADDREHRFLYPPSTAATLNMAAVAAQAARIWRESDPAFAARALAAATRAWAAAERHPALLASSDFTGSGGYGDAHLDDERFWAAAELYATTGDARYAAILTGSPFLTDPGRALGWGTTDLAGLLTLATVPNRLPPTTIGVIRHDIVAIADTFVAERARSGYALPNASPRYGWGSNGDLLNRAVILGVAWQLTHRAAYRDGAVDAVDYVLGRNALDRSFVTGFGARAMRYPHHRFWHPVDPRYPAPPSGVLSGGPNSTAMSDDVASRLKGRCTGQTCWVDDWRAFTMNEVAINWNAPLVWVSAFLDATRAPSPASASGSASASAPASMPSADADQSRPSIRTR